MTIALIGSLAVNHHIPGFREVPGDVDLIMRFETFQAWHAGLKNVKACYPIQDGKKFVVLRDQQPIHEIEIAYPGSTGEELLGMLEGGEHLAPGVEGQLYTIPTLDLLFTLKWSHRYLKNTPHFRKNRQDYERLKGQCRLVAPEWLKRREAATYHYSKPKLNQSKEGFFAGDAVKYVYDHDTLHEAVKLGGRPAYVAFKPLDKPVMVSRSMWDKLPYEVQLNSVVEEAYVLALERSQIPHGDKISPKGSFDLALEKVCTSITSGWWREFAYENFYAAERLYSDEYVEKFKRALSQGVVRPFNQPTQQPMEVM